MKPLKHIATDNAELLTVDQAARVCNLGIATTRALAKESGAERRIGRSVRIRKSVFLNYIDEMYS